MSTPITEKEQYSFPAFEPDQSSTLYSNITRTSEEDGTLQDIGEDSAYHGRPRLQTDYTQEFLQVPGASPLSASQHREQSQRLEDDLEMLRAERLVSNSEATQSEEMHKTRSMGRSRSRTNAVPEDDFDIGTVPIHEELKIYQPPAPPTTKFASALKKIHQSSFLVRYFCYIVPLVLLLLIPLLLGAFVFPNATVGDVRLVWFSIWLEIVWLTLWAGRILARCLPYPMGLISSLFTNDDKKWRDLGKELEVPATLFFWGLALEISFLPTMTSHHSNGDTTARYWEVICNKIIIALFAGVTLNFLEKILIQLIAISFHLRTYADRIDINRFQIGSLVKLYAYSKEKIAMEDSEFEIAQTGPSSGARTPMQYINKAGKNARGAINAVGDVVGKVAGDFTGRAVKKSSHPSQVILQLLGSTSGSQVLARRLYRTFAPEGSEVVLADDLRVAFDNNDEADAAFTMFDKDLNGDISMEELEAVCVEIGRERKAITASLKDLDSVVSKLNNVFVFIVIVITVLIFVSIISTSASGVLTSLGSSVLALSWLFSVTAQEFLQSCIFVFVKHPFDVGDRVTIYGNTGSQGKGDDYFVKEISLLFTEFKKMEGHVVQAPNSYLNTLFILNQRRSGGLAEGVPITVKFGTTLEQLDTLRSRLLDFVTSENREYQQNILTELTTVFEAYSISLNVVFFYKSNWQNELLRLQRRNKFICALMVAMQELGIEGPRQKLAGQSPDQPMYLNGAYPQMPTSAQPLDSSGNPTSSFSNISAPTSSLAPRSGSFARGDELHHPVPLGAHPSVLRNPSISSSTNRPRGESISQLAKRVDFSLGMSSISSGAQMGDIYSGPARQRLPSLIRKEPSPVRRSSVAQDEERTSSNLVRMTSRESSKLGSALGRTTSAEGSTGPSGRTHRNRFFGRSSNRLGTAEEGTDMDDLEVGRGGFSVEDLPDIPESSGVNSPICPHGDVEAEKAEQERPGQARIDPRSGIVSPQAVARDNALERGEILRLAPSQGSSDAMDRLL